MKDAVRKAFVSFTAPLEGVVEHLYLDVIGLVTIGIGNLVDPITVALELPLVRADGTPATLDEIATEWRTVKSHTELKIDGHRAAKKWCKLHLTPDGIEQVVSRKLDQMVAHLRERFPEWDEWPCDAQLAVLSMSWACGPAFRFATLDAACKAQDWMKASQSCHINTTGNPGIAPRNALNIELFQNASWVADRGLDRDTLVWAPPLPPEAA